MAAVPGKGNRCDYKHRLKLLNNLLRFLAVLNQCAIDFKFLSKLIPLQFFNRWFDLGKYFLVEIFEKTWQCFAIICFNTQKTTTSK